jgi:hypothetical protein
MGSNNYYLPFWRQWVISIMKIEEEVVGDRHEAIEKKDQGLF